MKRRDFLSTLAALMTTNTWGGEEPSQDIIMTVLGPIAPEQLGLALTHEHVLVDFIGAEEVGKDRYDVEEVFKTALPHLQKVKELGCRALMECTPAYIGRDAALLKRLAQDTGLHILTNTGYYGAANDKFVPKHAYDESADQLAQRWIREWEEGIEGTGIKPGFIKIGVDSGALSEIDKKIVTAAARTHKQTGLTVAAHTGDGKAALEEIEVMKQEGVNPEAFIWVHAQNEGDVEIHTQAAKAGAWVSLDGISPGSIERHLTLATALKDRGYIKNILLSHDAGWYHVGEPGGGEYRPYTSLFSDFIPALKQKGFAEEDIRQLLVDNPRRAFTIHRRVLSGY